MQLRLAQKEMYGKYNNKNYMSLPSVSAIKLSVMAIQKYNVRKLKRELLIKQLKYEELFNFLIY